MDTVMHALLGTLAVRSAFPAARSRQPLTNRQRMAVGAIAGAFPDIDYIASWETYGRFGDNGKNTGYIRTLWENPQLDYFRRFAEFPVLYQADNTADGHCVWFTDLRYVLPYMTPPFRYGLCQDKPTASWEMERLRR